VDRRAIITVGTRVDERMSWWLKGLVKVTGVTAAALVFLGVAGLTYEWLAERRNAIEFPPPGKLIDVDGRRLHLLCKGPAGSASVVMLAGGGTPSVASYEAQDRIATFAHVCSYDRAGLGWSDPAGHPLTLAEQISDLEKLLDRGGVRAPYVFVPESFGGLMALGYAARHRDRIAGFVFVDSVDDALWFGAMDTIAKHQSGFQPDYLAIGRRLGLVRLAIPYLAPAWTRSLTPAMRAQLFAVFARPSPGTREAVDLFQHTPPSDRLNPSSGTFGDAPIIAIRHGISTSEISPEFQAGWSAAQFRLAALSRDSSMIVATHNTHEISQENPELVAASVRRVLAKIAQRQPR